MSEEMDVVNDANQIVGKATQDEIYAQKLTHRIVHVFVINTKGEVYFQKRSEKKSYLPGFYCTSAGGHVHSGESYEQAAKRELVEELGLQVPIKKVHELIFAEAGLKRFIELFVACADGGINFADGEVASGEFLSLDKAQKLIEKGEKIHPQLDTCFGWLYKNAEAVNEKNKKVTLSGS